jgi:hypothetical protein
MRGSDRCAAVDRAPVECIGVVSGRAQISRL